MLKTMAALIATGGNTYCFKSSINLYSKRHGLRPMHVGTAICYGKTPLISVQTQRAAKKLLSDGAVDKVGEPELVIYEMCPIELSDEVFIHIFDVERRSVPFA